MCLSSAEDCGQAVRLRSIPRLLKPLQPVELDCIWTVRGGDAWTDYLKRLLSLLPAIFAPPKYILSCCPWSRCPGSPTSCGRTIASVILLLLLSQQLCGDLSWLCFSHCRPQWVGGGYVGATEEGGCQPACRRRHSVFVLQADSRHRK